MREIMLIVGSRDDVDAYHLNCVQDGFDQLPLINCDYFINSMCYIVNEDATAGIDYMATL